MGRPAGGAESGSAACLPPTAAAAARPARLARPVRRRCSLASQSRHVLRSAVQLTQFLVRHCGRDLGAARGHGGLRCAVAMRGQPRRRSGQHRRLGRSATWVCGSGTRSSCSPHCCPPLGKPSAIPRPSSAATWHPQAGTVRSPLAPRDALHAMWTCSGPHSHQAPPSPTHLLLLRFHTLGALLHVAVSALFAAACTSKGAGVGVASSVADRQTLTPNKQASRGGSPRGRPVNRLVPKREGCSRKVQCALAGQYLGSFFKACWPVPACQRALGGPCQ